MSDKIKVITAVINATSIATHLRPVMEKTVNCK